MKRNRSLIDKGTQFTRLTTTGKMEPRRDRSNMSVRWYECRCVCGALTWVTGTRLRRGITKSCGCLIGDSARVRMTEHGLSDTSIHNVWMAMINRCHKPRSTRYAFYG